MRFEGSRGVDGGTQECGACVTGQVGAGGAGGRARVGMGGAHEMV